MKKLILLKYEIGKDLEDDFWELPNQLGLNSYILSQYIFKMYIYWSFFFFFSFFFGGGISRFSVNSLKLLKIYCFCRALDW